MLDLIRRDKLESQVFRRNSIDQGRYAIAGEGEMPVDGKGVPEHLFAAFGISSTEIGRIAHRALHIFARERLIQMNAANISAKRSMPIQQGMNVSDTFFLSSQIQIRVQQMPGIEHDSPVRIANAIHQTLRHFRSGEGKPRLLEVLDEQGDAAILIFK